MEGCRTIFATCNDWELSSHVEIQRPYTRKNRVTRDIENYLTATPAASVGGLSLGYEKTFFQKKRIFSN